MVFQERIGGRTPPWSHEKEASAIANGKGSGLNKSCGGRSTGFMKYLALPLWSLTYWTSQVRSLMLTRLASLSQEGLTRQFVGGGQNLCKAWLGAVGEKMLLYTPVCLPLASVSLLLLCTREKVDGWPYSGGNTWSSIWCLRKPAASFLGEWCKYT